MRPEKESIAKEIQERLKGGTFILAVDYRGLKAERMTELRNRVRSAGSRMLVVPNTMLVRTVKDLNMGDASSFASGPTAVITGASDVTQMAKLLDAFIQENTLPLIKGGLFGGRVLSADDVRELVKIPSREILLGRLAGAIASPISGLVGVMNQKVLTLLYALNAVLDNRKKTADTPA